MLDNRIKFDERYDSEDYGTTTLYFIAPKEMLKEFIPTNDYPEVVSMEISIEFPTEHIEADYANVYVSPTKEDENGTEEYEWHDVNISHDKIEGLIKLAKTSNYEKRMKELELEYNEFLKTKSGQEWKEHCKHKTGSDLCGDFGNYLYDFYPEMLM